MTEKILGCAHAAPSVDVMQSQAEPLPIEAPVYPESCAVRAVAETA